MDYLFCTYIITCVFCFMVMTFKLSFRKQYFNYSLECSKDVNNNKAPIKAALNDKSTFQQKSEHCALICSHS